MAKVIQHDDGHIEVKSDGCDFGPKAPSGSAELPEELKRSRSYLRQAINNLDKYTEFNEHGKRYAISSCEIMMTEAFKLLKYFDKTTKI